MTLDLSKRSRSGKFRLVTKFKKEKNNKNRDAHGSLGAPGTAPRPLLSPWVLGLRARGPRAATPVVACAARPSVAAELGLAPLLWAGC